MELYPQKWVKFSLRTKLTLLIESLVVIIVVVTGIITTIREKERCGRIKMGTFISLG